MIRAFLNAAIGVEGRAIKATGGDEFFVVMTVQRGEAPRLAVEGQGLNSRVRVGNMTVSFDRERIALDLVTR